MAQLLVVASDGTERTVDLADSPDGAAAGVSFGRAEECDVVLTEIKASRRHCTVRPVAGSRGGWRVVDEGSSNGTWLGGKPILSARLQPGDEIQIGDTVIEFAATAAEMPKADVVRQRRVRKANVPWGALVGAAVIASAAFVIGGKVAQSSQSEASETWRGFARVSIDRAQLAPSDDAMRAALIAPRTALEGARSGESAIAMIDAAAKVGRPKSADSLAAWRRSLDQLESRRARQSVAERRSGLRELLARHIAEPAALRGIAQVAGADSGQAQDRAQAEADRLREEAEQAETDGRSGRAIEAWCGWFAAAPSVVHDEETRVVSRLAALRAKARADAEETLRVHQGHLAEGRLAAARTLLESAVERLRGSGYDLWIAARLTRGSGGAPGDDGAVAREPTVDPKLEAKIQKQRIDRALKTAEGLARRRKFADAAVLLREASAEIAEAGLRAEVEDRVADLSHVSDLLASLTSQVAADPSSFGAVPVAAAQAKVLGADAGSFAFDVGGSRRDVPLPDVAAATLSSLLERAKTEPIHAVYAAVLFRDLGEEALFTSWMRRALAVDAVRTEASQTYARLRGEKCPDAGYVPHPRDTTAICTYDERRRIENEKQIADFTAKLGRVVEKIEQTKQAKSVEAVAQVYVKLEAARNHALELIFDEVKYFYPYRTRMAEYTPVQIDVDERVKAVRELWEDRTVAKIRPDAALTKLLQEVTDVQTEIAFLGGDADALIERADRIRSCLGADGKGMDLTVQNFFLNGADQTLHEYNDGILAYNATFKVFVSEKEREQIRITNEYRRMMGHRRMLRIHDKLVESARGHSDDMARLGFFDHFSPVPGKKEPGDRMKLAGYPNVSCSENIAVAGGDPQSAFDGWFHSSGHHRNMLTKGWSELGTGQSGRYWTQNFGFAPGDQAAGGDGPH